MISLDCYAGASVLVTGDFGFVGKHLTRRLRQLVARVFGFDIECLSGPVQDIRQAHRIRDRIARLQPHYLFHLAAQAFVPRGYENPGNTFETNAQGTVNLLEALRDAHHGECAAVIVTTDKVVGRTGRIPADEKHPLVGLCPYSASKVMAEHAVTAYRESYFKPQGCIHVATARAGNIIGAGDHFGVGRLVPNAIEALRAGKPIPVFGGGKAIRPWQFIDDVIEGYLALGAALAQFPGRVSPAYNFGPRYHYSVMSVVNELIAAWGSGSYELVNSNLREVDELRITSDRARAELGWEPKWTFEEMIRETVRRYREEEGA